MTPDGRLARLPLLLRTVRHLPPRQVLERVRLRGQKAAMAALPGMTQALMTRPVPETLPGWGESYLPLDGREAIGYPTANENAKGRFHFVGEEHTVLRPADWENPEASQLWRYHLHYLEWAWSFAAHADRSWAREEFGRLWRAWQQGTVFGRWDAWSPYVVSLRTWMLCGIYAPLVRGSALDAEFVTTIGQHARFVRSNLEHDVGGNHLMKNLKALLGASVFLGDAANERLALRELHRQVAKQVLSDGGHFERSPSYHCQVLGDLIDLRDLLQAFRGAAPTFLAEAVAAMRRWLGLMLLPDGDVPLLNDCTVVGRERLSLLQPGPATSRPLQVLEPSGYVVVKPSEGVHLVLDVGPPCPPELPAHAQADCLSFVLSLDGQRVVVDTGTSTYQPGPRRDHERSTSAHNTVEVDGQDQTEVWGAFRAARRATPRLERAGWDGNRATVVASHDGYERLQGRPRHRRAWHVDGESMSIIDEVVGRGDHRVVSRLHLGPQVTAVLEVDGNGDARDAGESVASVRFFDGTARIDGDSAHLSLRTGYVASSFGHREETVVIETTAEGPLPLGVETRLVWRAESLDL